MKEDIKVSECKEGDRIFSAILSTRLGESLFLNATKSIFTIDLRTYNIIQLDQCFLNLAILRCKGFNSQGG